MRKYVLADMGIVCALGCGKEAVLRNMRSGASPGMKRLCGLSGGEETVFGFVPALPAPDSLGDIVRTDDGLRRVEALVDAAMSQIAPSLGAAIARFGAERIGAVVGTSNSDMEEFTSDPVAIDMSVPAKRIAARWGVKGPCWAVSTACSSSAKAFASARRLIESGLCDAVVAGGADAYTRMVVEGFHSLEALSGGLTRPLSPDRDGINLGEGAAFFLVMRAEDAPPAAGGPAVELLGVGESSDAYHQTAPDPDGAGAEKAMRLALADAGLEPGEISFVNMHGTGTVPNDAMETAALRRIFGGAEPPPGALLSEGLGVRAFSTKALTGHCLGAAGAVEAALCWLELREAPGTCLSNSFAFGGSNACVALGSGRGGGLRIERYIPHRRSMTMILAPADGGRTRAGTAEAYIDASPESVFYDPALGGVPACAAIEYMAQALALAVGRECREKGEIPEAGFLLGTRRMEVSIDRFLPDRRYTARAECSFTDGEFAAFDCSIADESGKTVASASLTVYKPGDLKEVEGM